MTTSVANLDTTQYVKVNAGQNPITLQAHRDLVRFVFSELKPSRDNPIFHTLGGNDSPQHFPLQDSNVWVLATTENSSLVITEFPEGELPVNTGYSLSNRFDLAVAAGLVPGATSITKFGVNANAPLNTKIDLWDVGGDYTFLSTAELLNLQSTDNDDANGDTGAHTVEVYGLDSDYNEISEIVTLNGVSSVPTVNQYLRCNRMIIRSAGSNGGAEGVITAESASTIQAQINNGFNQSLMAIWTVPAGKVFIPKYTEASIGKGKEGLFELKVRPIGEVFQTKKALKVFEKKSATRREFGGIIDEKSDIKIDVTADSNNSFVEGEFEGIILDKATFGIT